MLTKVSDLVVGGLSAVELVGTRLRDGRLVYEQVLFSKRSGSFVSI